MRRTDIERFNHNDIDWERLERFVRRLERHGPDRDRGDSLGQVSGMSRRHFLLSSATLSVALPLIAAGCGDGGDGGGVERNPYPLGTEPIADDVEGAIEWWLEKTESAVPHDSPEVVLTEDEIAELRQMNPSVGHQWYGFQVPAIEGWNRFWEEEVTKWASDPQIFDAQGEPERDIQGAQTLINSGVEVAGTLAVDWNSFNQVMTRYHDAEIGTTSVTAPSSALYPTTTTIMSDQVENARDLVLPMAEKLKQEGIEEAGLVLLPQARPAYFDVARVLGLKEGLEQPEVQEIAKIEILEEIPVGTPEEAQRATASALSRHGDEVNVIAALSHVYVGASGAVQEADRRDVWIMAFDLDQGTATELLGGGWPVYTTYSLPIADIGRADAHAMGKYLLGRDVPLIIRTAGTVVTPENVAEAYENDWGGEELPWQ